MIQMPEQLNLPQRPLGIHMIIERVRDLLDCNHLSRLRIHHRTTKKATEFNKKSTTKRNRRKKEIISPDDPVGAPADGHDARLVLDGDLEQVAEDVVLEEPAVVGQRHREVRGRSSVHWFRRLFDVKAAEVFADDREEVEEQVLNFFSNFSSFRIVGV